MKKPKYPLVSLSELRRFIKLQRNDRKINFWQGFKDDPIGCLLNHVCKSRKIKDYYTCGFSNASSDKNLGTVLAVTDDDGEELYGMGIGRLFKNRGMLDLRHNFTYGELKKNLI